MAPEVGSKSTQFSAKTAFLSRALEHKNGRWMFKPPAQGGEVWYVVAIKWWKEFAGKDMAFTCSNIPTLDNSGLLDAHGKLRENLCRGLQFELVPGDVYQQLKLVFPSELQSGEEIPRMSTRDRSIEVYLCECTIALKTQGEEEEVGAWKHSFSKDCTLQDLCDTIALHFSCPISELKQLRSGTDYVRLDLDRNTTKTLDELRFSLKNNRLLATTTTVQQQQPHQSKMTKMTPQSQQQQPLLLLPPPPPPVTKTDLVGTCGLFNIGNSCYLNSVLQCLCHTGPLRALLMSNKSFESRINATNPLGKRGESVIALHAMFQDLWSYKRYSSPLSFKQKLDEWTALFRGSQQHDAHELLQYLLDLVHEDTTAQETVSASICNEVFGGVLNRTITCPVCHESALATPEPFHMLSLPLDQSDILFIPLLGQARYIHVMAKTPKQARAEAESKLKVPVIWKDNQAFEVDPVAAADDEGMYVFAMHQVASKPYGAPFHFYLPAPKQTNECQVKQMLETRFGSGIPFDLVRVGSDELIVKWESYNCRVPALPINRHTTKFDLRRILARFFEEEAMEGDNLWFCPTCKEKRAAVLTKYSIASPTPQVLVLHLKRFSNTMTKITNAVRFPMQLELPSTDKYALFAVLRHHGTSVHSGHYDAQILHAVDNRWYTYNDSVVTPMQFLFRGKFLPSAPSPLDCSAYMYFYRKI